MVVGKLRRFRLEGKGRGSTNRRLPGSIIEERSLQEAATTSQVQLVSHGSDSMSSGSAEQVVELGEPHAL